MEDEAALSRVFKLKLEKAGFDVVTAVDGEEGLVKLADSKFDLILLDLVMPKLDGFGVLEKLKEVGGKVPVIVTSNLSQPVKVDRALGLGARAFLVKSDTSLEKMVETVVDFLDGAGK